MRFMSNRLQRTYFRLFGHQIDQRFAIVGNARTGSNYLLDGLKTSPSIRMYHEIFADHNRRVERILKRSFPLSFNTKVNPPRWLVSRFFTIISPRRSGRKLMAYKDLKSYPSDKKKPPKNSHFPGNCFKTGQWTKSGRAGRSEINASRLIL